MNYSQQELAELRALISRLRFLDKSITEEIDAAISSGICPPHLAPFWSLATTNPGLWDKLGSDPLVRTYSIHGFFPKAYELVYQRQPRPDIVFEGRTRGRIAIIRGGDAGLVVKPMQSQRENEIAGIAGELDVGPQQYQSLPGFLTEEFVTGRFFTELPPEMVNAEAMFRIGGNLGTMLARLHLQQIYYNDTTLSDPSGRSHLMVMNDGSCRLIDFGVSLHLDRHPRYTPEEVYNFVRTLPMFHLFSGMGVESEEITGFLQQYRQHLANASKEEIMARDVRFMEEGLRLAAQRMGKHIVSPFRDGFRQSYD